METMVSESWSEECCKKFAAESVASVLSKRFSKFQAEYLADFQNVDEALRQMKSLHLRPQRHREHR